MTDRQPRPVGDPHTAYVRVLRRARKAEERCRALRAENTNLRAQSGTQEER